jgi:cysteine-rich repeat protein
MTCGTGTISCAGECADLLDNPDHCGACGNTCLSGSCALGVCQSPSGCGDGVIDDEQCDDGNTADDDGCNSICEVEAGWQCSASSETDAETDAGIALGSMCTPICGDGNVTPPEQCDPADENGDEGCSADCTMEE